MVKKGPRRTAERILETSLALFNRFGEPNVSTTLIASELGISPGNLYYHYPAKDVLVSRLYDRFELSVLELLHAADEVQDVEAAWFFLHALFERIWEYRFLYRDLNDLLSRIRHLETQVRQLLLHKTRALRLMLDAMRRAGTLQIEGSAADSLAATMVVVLTYWFSYVYALSPRTALEEEQSTDAPLQGARHVLGMLLPQLAPEARAHFLSLVDAYGEPVR